MPLTVKGLMADFRRVMDDPELPGSGTDSDEDSLWSNADILHYLDAAQRDLAQRTLSIKQTLDAVAVTASQTSIAIPDYVIQVRRAVRGDGFRLMIVNENEDRDQHYEDYGIEVASLLDGTEEGPVKYLVLDYESGLGHIRPLPSASDNITLNVSRYPERQITRNTDTLEISAPRWRDAYIYFMRSRGYDKADADGKNEDLSNRFLERYYTELQVQQHVTGLQQRRPGTVRMGGGVW